MAQLALKRFFDLSIDMLCIAEIDGYFKVLSPSFEKTLGITLDELMSKPYIEFIHPDDRQATIHVAEYASKGIPVYNFHNRYLCKDGTYKYLSWTALPIPEEGLSYCTATDVTDQRKLQEALKQELALQSSIAKVTAALLDPTIDKHAISNIVHEESLILTDSVHGYASLIDEKGDNVAYTLTNMMGKECQIAMELQTIKFPKGQDGYNALWGHSLNTGEDFFTNSPHEHIAYKNCAPPGHVEIKNFLSVVVKGGGKIIGQIAVANSSRDYTERDLLIVRQLASIYAVAIERKELEERLVSSEQRFRTVFENAPVGAVLTDAATGAYVQVNQAFCNITGYSCKELLGLTFKDITHPDDIERQIYGLILLERGKIPVHSMEKRYIHKNSNIIWVAITFISLYIDSNQPPLILATVEDITEVKQLTEALKERELDIIEIQKKAQFGTWTFNPVSQQSEWSLELYNIWGIDPKSGPPLYEQLKDHIHPDDRQQFDDIVKESIELNKPYDLEMRICRPDKTERVIHAIGEPAVDDAGKVVKLRGSYHDITERKAMEKELKQLNTNLESLVVEETQKRRQNEQMLIQQSKMAAMGEMIGLIAHQWRQPLNAIGITVQDLKDAYAYGELNDKYINETVDVTMSQVNFMSKTINDFRNFYKPSKEKCRFDVKAAVEELLWMFEQIFKKSGIDITIETVQHTELSTDGYPNEFKQVLLNILNNAKDAITAKKESEGSAYTGQIEIIIGTDEDKNKIIVSIRDNGGGIPQHILERIFEPYYTTKGEQGTGIGLYMCKTIIETNMGGSLSARNYDGGAEFTISMGIAR
ncbi:MAG: PAS domain S-box protein [Nitrospirae bacterium]|nr:PAS domain S-box protein [Nitrospirota bacterium]